MSEAIEYSKENNNDIWSAIRSLKSSLNSRKVMIKDKNKRMSIPNLKNDGYLNINSLSFTCETEPTDYNTQPGLLCIREFKLIIIRFFQCFPYFSSL